MIALSVNLNKIALIRNSRDTTNPSIPEHAQMCIDAGADGITVHPRPDQRHIRADDCYDLAKMLDVEFNIEGNPFTGPRGSDRWCRNCSTSGSWGTWIWPGRKGEFSSVESVPKI